MPRKRNPNNDYGTEEITAELVEGGAPMDLGEQIGEAEAPIGDETALDLCAGDGDGCDDCTEETCAPAEVSEAITTDELLAERPLVESYAEMRTLYTDLTDDRRDSLSEELVESTLALEAQREAKRSADAVFNGKIKALELKCQKIATTLDEGAEEGTVACRWFIDYTLGRRELKRLDNGKVIDVLELTYEERQVRMELEDAQADTTPTLYNHFRCNACSWTWQVEPTSDLPADVVCPSCDSKAISLWGDGVINEQVPHLEPNVAPRDRTDRSVAWRQGVQAFLDGEDRNANPYNAETQDEQDQWEEGYLGAKEEAGIDDDAMVDADEFDDDEVDGDDPLPAPWGGEDDE